MQDLNDLVLPGHGFQLIGEANDINNKGQIVAIGYTDISRGIYHSVLLDPVAFEVVIDIKPGSHPNSINLESNGVVPVAILTIADFDASTIDPATVKFAGASPIKRTMVDVDQDGYIDMLLYFDIQELNLEANSTEATLTGMTDDGVEIVGTDSVKIVTRGKK